MKKNVSSLANDLARDITNLIIDSTRDPKVEMWERELISDFGSRITVSIVEMERDYEEHKDENPAVREYFFRTFSRIMSTPAILPRGINLGETAAKRIQEIWSALLEWLDGFIKERKKTLNIDSWTIGATAGFPFGIGGTVSVTFKE